MKKESRYDVTALGEILIDFAGVDRDENGYPTLKANPGGAPANYLSALSTYGYKTAFIGKVGVDMFGDLLIDTLKQQKIDTKAVLRDPGVFTTLAFVSLDKRGERAFSFARKPGADTCLRADEIDNSLIADSRVFHFGSLSLTDEPSFSATAAALRCARENSCLISYDPNLRIPLWSDLSLAKEKILWGLEWADVVKIADEEVEFLFDVDIEEAAEIMIAKYHVQLVFVTLGSKGAYFHNSKCSGYVKCPEVNCIDTTGAGDIFGGSAMAMILKTGKDIEELDYDDLFSITSFACAAASLSTEKSGGLGSAPTITAIEKIRGGV